jgi:DeoR/GlpR family transcriptional regulator of sugar metabolism
VIPEHRRRQLLEQIKQNGAARVPELAEQLGVSPATVRRDLLLLERSGEIKRTHGGAVLPHLSTSFEPRYHEKAQHQADAKRLIAREAGRLVHNGEVVILDSGSTTFALALELKTKRNLTVITTDIKIANELADHPELEVIVVGGKVRPELYSLIGHFAEQALRNVHANKAFIGADAISLKAGVTNATFEEVPVKQLAIAAADEVYLLADHTKLDKVSLAKVADLAAFDLFITDAGIDPKVAARYRDSGLDLVVASA